MLTPERIRHVVGVIPRSNGNLVLESIGDHRNTVLTEIDMDGIIERKYTSSLRGRVNFVDTSGRIAIDDPVNGVELLDAELNLLEYTGPQPNKREFTFYSSWHYNSQRNESIGISGPGLRKGVLTIFRFSEE